MSVMANPNGGTRARGYSGFTLVEVMIALLLLSLIAVLMAGVLRTASQTWTKVAAHQDTAQQRLLINQFLRRQLTSIRFVKMRMIDDQRISSFLGGSEALHYVAPFPTFHNNKKLYWWTLMSRFDTESGVDQLLLQYRPFYSDDLVDIDEDGSLLLTPSQFDDLNEEEELEDLEPTTLVLAENVVIVSMEFFTRDKLGEEHWFDEWEPLELTPWVIRLTIAETDDAGNEWVFPELAVAPRFAHRQIVTLVDDSI